MANEIEQRAKLDALEKVITDHLPSVLLVATSLQEIKSRALYKWTHSSWEAYVNDRFGFTRQWADYQIARIATNKQKESEDRKEPATDLQKPPKPPKEKKPAKSKPESKPKQGELLDKNAEPVEEFDGYNQDADEVGTPRVLVAEFAELWNEADEDERQSILDFLGEQGYTVKKKAAKKRFAKPTIDEVLAYCDVRGNNVDAEAFCDFYESKGWKVGSQPMKDWNAAVRTWEKRHESNGQSNGQSNGSNELTDLILGKR